MDTLIIRDSVAIVTDKATFTCQPCVKEILAFNEVIIVTVICMTVIIIALCAIFRYFKWKDDVRNAIKAAEEKKREFEEKDRGTKKQADKEAHDQNQQDHKLKRKEELENKLHNYMGNRIKEGDSIDENDKYIAELQQRINAIKIQDNG